MSCCAQVFRRRVLPILPGMARARELGTVVLILCMVMGFAGGCGGNRRKANVVRPYKLPQPPPAVPAVQKVPINKALIEAAKQELVKSFGSKDPVVRAHAIEAMQTTVPAEMATQLLAGLSDRNPVVRFAAAMAVGQLEMNDAKPALLKLAEDPDASVRIGAKFALHRLGDTRFSHDFEYTWRDPVKSTRANTALALGLLGEPSAAQILVFMLRDQDATVRLQAAEALWRLGDQRGLEPLISATISRFPDDQMIALLALAQPKDTRVSQNIRGSLTSEYDEVSLIAARAMGMLNSDEGYGVALKGAKSGDRRQRLLSAMAFGAIARSDSQDVLKKLLNDADPDVRLAAAAAILQLRP
jgi:HEAT repeat protein